MAFRLRPHESVSRGLRRLASKELRAVTTELGKDGRPNDKAIHEARKSLKKVRAVFRLISAEGGHGLAGSKKRLRKVNRLLSRIRDAAAQLETLATLRKEFPDTVDVSTFRRVRHLLANAKRREERAARSNGAWDKAAKASRDLQKLVRRWKLEHRQFDALAPGIRDEYERGREMMRAASQRRRAKDFHEWRKRLKGLWYDLRLVEEYDPKAQRLASLLHTTEAWLGDDHNVVILCAQVKKLASPADRERLRKAAERHQRVLRAKALEAGARLYAATPQSTVNLAARAWQASQ
jgi:CHAD domain-containing protein